MARTEQRVESNIYLITKKGRVSFRVFVMVRGVSHRGTYRTLDQARVARDRLLEMQARPRACLNCGAAFTPLGKGERKYCSRECGEAARARGLLVKPMRAVPATRRRAREIQKERSEARRVEILSDPRTFGEIVYGEGEK